MSGAKIYVDLFSQPSRSCVILCRVARLDVEEVLVNIAKGGTRSPDYLAINPLGKVPFYQEPDGFSLPESAAIMRYLCRKHNVEDHWYPKDIKKCARVDAVLDWHGSTLRAGSMVVVWNRIMSMTLKFKPKEEVVLSFGLPTLKTALQTIETVWLKDSKFVAGDEISIADLLLSCEIESLTWLDGADIGPTYVELMADYPKVQTWLLDVSNEFRPHYTDVHSMVQKLRARLLQSKSSKM